MLEEIQEKFFIRSGARLKRAIPVIFVVNVVLILLTYVFGVLGILFSGEFCAAATAAIVGIFGVLVECASVLMVLIFLYSLAEQSDNTCQILELMQQQDFAHLSQKEPAPVQKPAPTPIQLQTAQEPVMKARPAADQPEEKKPVVPEEEIKPQTTADPNMIQCPVCGTVQRKDRNRCWDCGARFEQEKGDPFKEGLAYALRFESNRGMNGHLEKMAKAETDDSRRQMLQQVLAEPEESRRAALQKLYDQQ